MTANELYFVDLVEFTQPNGSSEEYFFIVADSKRKEDVGSLLHIAGTRHPPALSQHYRKFLSSPPKYLQKSRVSRVREVRDRLCQYCQLCSPVRDAAKHKNRQGHLSSLEEGYGPGGDTQTCLDYMKQENGPVLREFPPGFHDHCVLISPSIVKSAGPTYKKKKACGYLNAFIFA